MNKNNKATLLCYCQDKKGVVAQVTEYLQKQNANILDLDQHVDKLNSLFFMRIEWDLDGYSISEDQIIEHFEIHVANGFDLKYKIHFSSNKPRVALFVSKASHCLYDILQRFVSKEWDIEIPIIISNHENFRAIAENYGIDFHHIPITKETKAEQEQKEIDLMKEYDIDLIVLARYMQILSDDFVSNFPNKIINIHHSFLPAFVGAKPYHQAYERGVKIIGATSHYVTAELDAGPIIAQGVVDITHRDEIHDLKRKGKNLEKMILSEGIWLHIQRKILSYNNRTIIFN